MAELIIAEVSRGSEVVSQVWIVGRQDYFRIADLAREILVVGNTVLQSQLPSRNGDQTCQARNVQKAEFLKVSVSALEIWRQSKIAWHREST